jgi:hypothetical protein
MTSSNSSWSSPRFQLQHQPSTHPELVISQRSPQQGVVITTVLAGAVASVLAFFAFVILLNLVWHVALFVTTYNNRPHYKLKK